MRTKIYTAALITMMILANSIFTFANPITFEEEAYINDIPFDTEMIYENAVLENSFTFDGEDYINDIPFSTNEIVFGIDGESLPEFTDEAYIDDIPFETKDSVSELKYITSTSIDFLFEEEAYIDDIPFNTELLVSEKENNPTINHFFIETHQTVLF